MLAGKTKEREMTAYEITRKYPKVFAILKDENRNERIGINVNAPLKDLFNAYSDIVHYIDGPTVKGLEELIRKKIRQCGEKNG